MLVCGVLYKFMADLNTTPIDNLNVKSCLKCCSFIQTNCNAFDLFLGYCSDLFSCNANVRFHFCIFI